MKNKQSSIEWFSNQSYELFEQYSEGNFNRTILNKLMVEATEQAEEMHKQEIIDAIDSFYDYKNWSKDLPTKGEQYYNETYGGNK